MEVVNLLEFLNKSSELYVLDYSVQSKQLVNFLNLMLEDEQFTQKIDLGLVFVKSKGLNQYLIIDGVNRILSLSLLLHAVCECYKKTSQQNDKAIKIIKNKYLVKNLNFKLRLNNDDDLLYRKIINGERLSGKEKQKPMFVLLHSFWSQIKNESLQASKIFNMLKKITVTLVDADSVPVRDLYYKLNEQRELDQILLIEDYLKEFGVLDKWLNIKKRCFISRNDIYLFFKDFFITKFNFKKFKSERLYENFVNYFETMLQYLSEDGIIEKIGKAAILYYNMLNVEFDNDTIREAFIKIKKYSGSDTFPYLLEVYQDYSENNISMETFIDILNTIIEYLSNRQKTGNNIEFNELIQYLNAFIACK